MEINKELKNLAPGHTALGYVGEPPKVETEDEGEKLTAKDKEYKKLLQALLLKYVEPPVISESKPNPARDKAALKKKVEHQTLGELRRFWTGKIPEELTEDEVYELNRKWKDLSP